MCGRQVQAVYWLVLTQHGIYSRGVALNLPVWEHWILKVQSFTPWFKPVYVQSHLTPELLWLVPRCGEGSAVRRVGCIVSAALQGQTLTDVCRYVRSLCSYATLSCS